MLTTALIIMIIAIIGYVAIVTTASSAFPHEPDTPPPVAYMSAKTYHHINSFLYTFVVCFVIMALRKTKRFWKRIRISAQVRSHTMTLLFGRGILRT